MLQPPVIYIDCAEKPFLKKVPKTDERDPKHMKKDLPKIVKGISHEDQVGMLHQPNMRYTHFTTNIQPALTRHKRNEYASDAREILL